MDKLHVEEFVIWTCKLVIDQFQEKTSHHPCRGSGKTTFLHRLVCHTQASNIRGYVMTLPYGANIGIRDTVRYKEVMKQFNLGPNGGILTSLKLFATKFDEVVSLIEKQADQLDYVLVDTPGQIEIFTCILYKTRLPLVLAFNKIDVAQHEFALEWMQDFEAFQAASNSDNSYSASFTQSLSIALEEFYQNLRSVGVSAVSGAGMDDFFKAIDASIDEYMETCKYFSNFDQFYSCYCRPVWSVHVINISFPRFCYCLYTAELDKRRAEKLRLEEEQRKESMDKLRDMEKSRGDTLVLSTGKGPKKNFPSLSKLLRVEGHYKESIRSTPDRVGIGAPTVTMYKLGPGPVQQASPMYGKQQRESPNMSRGRPLRRKDQYTKVST
ncbi:hypothetical protein Ddye_001096 [Dipteronia dyeriana]|uniref:GPN-loop GTPase n=1 Tax=Dipteronia dyeriana TaxID=168575 RepID=A0AAD9XNN3_9ROSI|nr:hypothetical protein Ddye_001096 [Dipteronia dyeriana]